MNNSLELLDNLFSALEQENVRYCVWKSVHDIASGLAGLNDLDILVEPEDAHKFSILLFQHKFVRNDSISPRHYRFVEDYFGLDGETGRVVKIQVYTRIVTGSLYIKEYSPSLDSLILGSRIRFKDTEVLAVDERLDYKLNMVRLALKIRIRDFVFQFVGKDIVSRRLMLEKSSYSSVSNSKYEITCECSQLRKCLDIEAPSDNSFLRWALYQRRLKSTLAPSRAGGEFQFIFEKTSREFSRIFRRLAQYFGFVTVLEHRTFKNRGLVVVFLGQDGAGKTTTLSLISQEYKKHFDVVDIYLGSGEGKTSIVRLPMLWLYKRLIKSGRVKTRAHTVTSDDSRAISSLEKSESSNNVRTLLSDGARLVWTLLVCMERRTKYRQLSRAYSAGKLVLVDRMPQTQISDGPDTLRTVRIKSMPHFGKFGKFVSSYEKNTFALFESFMPELVIKMVVEPLEAVRRKPSEVTEEYSLKSRQHIEMLNLGKTTLLIDNTSNFDENKVRIMKAIWHAAP